MLLKENQANYYIGTIDSDPLSFWKAHKAEYPVLAKLARDILSIPATGAGVERLFNSAHDICHCRRGSLNATTIQDPMRYLYTYDLKRRIHSLPFTKGFLSCNEVDAGIEEKEAADSDDLVKILYKSG
jgi:hypothetical protein